MAQVPMKTGHASKDATLQLVGFKVGNEEFGVDILKVQEIIRLVPVAAMPNTPAHVEGVINLRGCIIPVIDFRKRFGIGGELTGGDATKRIVVVAFDNTTVGIIVDSVSQVIKLPESEIAATPLVARGDDNEAIAGVGQHDGKLLIILDVTQFDPARGEEAYAVEAA